MCRLAGRRCPSSQGPAGPGVYATRRTNRKYRRDLAALVRESGNEELAAKIMKAPFSAMPMLTEAAGLCAEDVSSAPLPGQTGNHAIEAADKRLAAEVGKVSGDIISRADARPDPASITPEDAAEKVSGDVSEISEMTAEALEQETLDLQRRIKVLNSQADKADERGKFRLAEKLDQDVEDAEARLSLVRQEIDHRSGWTDEDEKTHADSLAFAADPYYRPDDKLDTLVRDYTRDPMFITGLSEDALRNIHELVPGDDPESRAVRIAAMNELARHHGILDGDLYSRSMEDKMAERGADVRNYLPGADPGATSDALNMYTDSTIDDVRAALVDVDPEDPKALVASRDRIHDLSSAYRDTADSIDTQLLYMGEDDQMRGPDGHLISRDEAEALASELREESFRFDDAADTVSTAAANAGVDLPPLPTEEERAARAAEKVHLDVIASRDTSPEAVDDWLRQVVGPQSTDDYAELSSGDLHLLAAESVGTGSGQESAERRAKIAQEYLYRQGTVPGSLASKIVEDKARQDGFSIFNQAPGQQDLGGLIHAAGVPGHDTGLNRYVHTKGQTAGVDEFDLPRNWSDLDGKARSYADAASNLRAQAEMMGPKDVMEGIAEGESMTRDQVLARADALQQSADTLSSAADSVAQEYRSRIGDHAAAQKTLDTARSERLTGAAMQAQAGEMSRRRVNEIEADNLRRRLREHIASEVPASDGTSGPSLEELTEQLDRKVGDIDPGSASYKLLQSGALMTSDDVEKSQSSRKEFEALSGLSAPTKSPKFESVTKKELERAKADLAAADELRQTASVLDDGGRLVIPNTGSGEDGDPESSITKEDALSRADMAAESARTRLGAAERLRDSRDFPEVTGHYTAEAAKVFADYGARPSVAGIAEVARGLDPIPYDAEIKKARTFEEYADAVLTSKKRGDEYGKMSAALNGVHTAAGNSNKARDERKAIREMATRLNESAGNGYWVAERAKEVEKYGLTDYTTLDAIRTHAPKAFADARSKSEAQTRGMLEESAGRLRYSAPDTYQRLHPTDQSDVLDEMFRDSRTYGRPQYGHTKLSDRIDKAVESAVADGKSDPDDLAWKAIESAPAKEIQEVCDAIWIDYHREHQDFERDFSERVEGEDIDQRERQKVAAYLLSRREHLENLQREVKKDRSKMLEMFAFTIRGDAQDEIENLDDPDRELPPPGMDPLFDLPDPKAA